MALIVLEDLNGTNYLGLNEGENLSTGNEKQVVFPHDFPRAGNPLEVLTLTVEQGVAFIRHNAYHLHVNEVSLTIPQCYLVAYLRLLAVKNGLISPNFAPNTYHVSYNDAVVLSDQATIAAAQAFDGAGVTEAAFQATLTVAVRKKLRETFTDRVCLVAFVFRSRGHHWTADYEALYEKVWRKMRFTPEENLVPFKAQAINAFHAIYPIILDAFWNHSVQNSYCNGAIAKRYDVAPAGAAGPYVLYQGANDLCCVAPGLKLRFQEHLQYLEETMVHLRANRWDGSVNARYYNASRRRFDEKRLGVIAATIVAALEAFGQDAPLVQSPALKRIATNAPITGAVYGRSIRVLAEQPAVINGLLTAPE